MNLIINNILTLAVSFAVIASASPVSSLKRAEPKLPNCNDPGAHRCGLIVHRDPDLSKPPTVSIASGTCLNIGAGGSLDPGRDGYHGDFPTVYGEHLYFKDRRPPYPARLNFAAVEFQYRGKSYSQLHDCHLYPGDIWQCDFDC